MDYNTKKNHHHLNYLTPDAWALEARQFPNQKFILKKDLSNFKINENKLIEESNPIIEMQKEIGLKEKEELESLVDNDPNLKTKQIETEIDSDKSSVLKDCEIVALDDLSKNNNSLSAKEIRHYKNNIGILNLIELVESKKIDLSKLDKLTQETYKELSEYTKSWKEDVQYLETIMFQNQVLLVNLKELKEHRLKNFVHLLRV